MLFTKLYGDLGVPTIGERTAELGFDGVDLLVRPGFAVEPEAYARIGPVVRELTRYGLEVPMATTDLTDPAGYPGDADRVLGALASAGVGLVRLGYWTYPGGVGGAGGEVGEGGGGGGAGAYREILERARRDLDGLERLGARHGLRLAIQLHGGTIHASGSLTRALIDGRDPARIGAYPDPGNQAVQDGREDWRLTFDLLAPWLCCVGVKNGFWSAGAVRASGQRAWHADWAGLADGMVPWDAILGWLVSSGYAGPLSFHSHYELPLEQVLDQTRLDLRYARRVLAAAADPGAVSESGSGESGSIGSGGEHR